MGMKSFPFALEQNLVGYISTNISSSYPVLAGHTNNPTASFDLPIIAIVCESYVDESYGYGLMKAEFRVDIVANAYDENTYEEFDNADDQIQTLLSNQDAVRSYVNIPSSSLFLAGIFLEGNNTMLGDGNNDFTNSRRYSVFAQQLYPSSSVIYPLTQS